MAQILDNTCRRCYGERWFVNTNGFKHLCPRCKGTGNEPETFFLFAPRFALGLILLITTVAIWAINGVK